jgi:hypothetical protein
LLRSWVFPWKRLITYFPVEEGIFLLSSHFPSRLGRK